VPARQWFRRFWSTHDEVVRVERIIAVVRLCLAAAALLATVLFPSAPVAHLPIVRLLIAIYVVFGASVLVLLGTTSSSPSALPLVTHVGDVCAAAGVMLFTDGANSPSIVLVGFVLLTAAFRWGEEKQRRTDASSVAAVMRKARVRAGLKGTTEGVFAEVLPLFRAARAVLVVRDTATGETFRWDSDPSHRQQESTFLPAAVDPTTGEPELFEAPGDGWYAIASPDVRHHSDSEGRRAAERFDIVALDADGRRLPVTVFSPPASFLTRYPYRSILAVTMTLGDAWTGRTYLFDSDIRRDRDRERAVRFAQRLARDVGPATYDVFLLHRMQTHAEAHERARLARELHDGIMQTLVASQMQVDLLRRQALREAPHLVDGLARVQALLCEEVFGLRDLTQRLRSLAITPTRSLEHLADIVERFQRETGIHARFVTNVATASLSPRACREVALIVLEALVNIRKHSGARHVLVRLAATGGLWKLSIEDDGRGFAFAGRWSHGELDAAHMGPIVIKERVNALGGELTLDSKPGEGARLEIAFH
jgi:signal transduction histidine kinase